MAPAAAFFSFSINGRPPLIHGSPDVYSQIWLLKIRYGLTDRLELSTVGSYINNKRDNLSPEH
ncbi:hypothetical protein ONN26_24690, partial [Salmonella enterica subsp. enterica serovar Muenster]|nr:hypothetical protein [Salmonella enterica subsp. enterica serovar Muenster]